jgi:hypothetical protein
MHGFGRSSAQLDLAGTSSSLRIEATDPNALVNRVYFDLSN